MGDYNLHGAVAGDNAGPAINALIHGDLSTFIARQPLMGMTSILIRLPAAALAAVMHASPLGAYRWGALACLLPGGVLSGWMVHQAGPSTTARLAALLAAASVLASPAASEAVGIGHPEEILASVLATGAVLAATTRHHRSAAVLLGLAIGTKQWALLAAGPVLLALRHQRLKTATVAGSVGALLTVAAPLAGPSAFAQAGAAVGSGHFTDPFSVWWSVGARMSRTPGAVVVSAHRLPFGLTRSAAAAIALGVAIAVLVLIDLRRRTRSRDVDALALLALLGLLRCVADPVPLQYNFVDLLIPLAVWEAVRLRRLPVTAYVAMGVVWLTAGGAIQAAPSVLSVLSLAFAVTLGSYLTCCAFPGRARGVIVDAAAIAPDRDMGLMPRW
jgi:hypothetical protein